MRVDQVSIYVHIHIYILYTEIYFFHKKFFAYLPYTNYIIGKSYPSGTGTVDGRGKRKILYFQVQIFTQCSDNMYTYKSKSIINIVKYGCVLLYLTYICYV